jgi:Domain of unknown function (DUF932)
MNFMMNRDSIYTSTARFDGSARALTEDEMHKIAPSIFATTAHESRSARFAPIPTIEVLRGLQKEGFAPVGVKQSTSRIPGKENFTKHLIRLRRLDNTELTVGDTVFEMLLKNANDGTARYSLMAGLFRIACSNSLVALVNTMDDVKVGHTGSIEKVQHKVIEGTYRVLDNAQAALAAPQDWSQIQLNRDEQMAFAEAAHVLRFEDADKAPVEPAKLLTAQRREDTASDTWTVFNRIQENVIRGGLHGVTRDANGNRRRVTTRPINGIDQDVKLNRALFTLATRMAELKAA